MKLQAKDDVPMMHSRRDGLTFLILGAVIFVLLGTVLAIAQSSVADFRAQYFTARSLLQHVDPYNEQQVMNLYVQSGHEPADETTGARMVVTRYLYLPSAFAITVPLALLPFRLAEVLWIASNGIGLIVAALLLWNVAAQWAPLLAGGLLGFLLANSEMIIQSRNVAGIAVSLCVIAAWCFLNNRCIAGGVLCLTVSLALKPHDSILVWLCFLLAGGVYRRRALQTLAVVLAISLPMVFWLGRVAPEWPQELRSHLVADSVRGGANDPGPQSTGAHALGMMVNLQTAASFFRDDPNFYNPVTYAICGVLLLVWTVTVLRRPLSNADLWIALACVSGLTMLPFYHRQFDAKLLMLSVPACAMLWAEKRPSGKLALLITAGAILFTAELPVAAVLIIISHLHLPKAAFWNQVIIGVQVLPAPVGLLAVAAFYLCIHICRARRIETPRPAAKSPEATALQI